MTYSGKIVGASKQGGGENRWYLTVEVEGGSTSELLKDAGGIDKNQVIGSKRTDADLSKLLGDLATVSTAPVPAPVSAPTEEVAP